MFTIQSKNFRLANCKGYSYIVLQRKNFISMLCLVYYFFLMKSNAICIHQFKYLQNLTKSLKYNVFSNKIYKPKQLFLLIQFSYIRIRFGTNCLNREISKIRRKTGRFFSPVVSCHESFVEVLIATLIKYSRRDSFQGVKVRFFNGLQ